MSDLHLKISDLIKTGLTLLQVYRKLKDIGLDIPYVEVKTIFIDIINKKKGV